MVNSSLLSGRWLGCHFLFVFDYVSVICACKPLLITEEDDSTVL